MLHGSVAAAQHRRARGPRQTRGIWLSVVLGVSLGAALVPSCVAPADNTINCDNIRTPEEARFSDIEALVALPGKGCAAADCHGDEEANGGYRFDERSLIYDAFTAHIDAVYGQVASGKMPEEGTRWSDDDLELVRSWYCNGSYPND